MKLLVTGAFNCTTEQINALKNMGNEVLFMQNENGELPDGADDVEGIICNGLFLHHNIETFSKLKYIQLTSAGFDRVPMEYVQQNNITIHNAKGVYSIPMAEFAVCGVLQLYKKVRELINSQNNSVWKKERDIQEIFGKTVCVVGCGSVGTEVAKRFSAFGCRVVGVDIASVTDEVYTQMYSLDNMSEALKESDIVVLTLPLTEKTENLFNKKTFEMMKNGAVLVNIARGLIVNTEDMIKALNEQELSGVVLDVFEEEPLSQMSVLWDMKNVIITPHNSFVGEGNNQRLWSVIKNNLENYI